MNLDYIKLIFNLQILLNEQNSSLQVIKVEVNGNLIWEGIHPEPVAQRSEFRNEFITCKKNRLKTKTVSIYSEN